MRNGFRSVSDVVCRRDGTGNFFRMNGPVVATAGLRESVFRTLKSELNLRPIFHRIQSRVEAHILIAFLGYCLWVCLKQKLRSLGGSLTPAQVLHTLKQILIVEVWFDLRRGGQICLPRITQPEAPAQLILHRLGWSLPEQPPPRIYRDQNRFVGTT